MTPSSPGRTSRIGCQSWTLGAPTRRTWTQRHRPAPRACWKSGLGGGPRKVSIKVASAFFLPMSTPSRPPGEGPSSGPEAAVTLPSVSQKGPPRLLSPAPARPPRAPSLPLQGAPGFFPAIGSRRPRTEPHLRVRSLRPGWGEVGSAPSSLFCAPGSRGRDSGLPHPFPSLPEPGLRPRRRGAATGEEQGEGRRGYLRLLLGVR